jgi:hypothetical protein
MLETLACIGVPAFGQNSVSQRWYARGHRYNVFLPGCIADNCLRRKKLQAREFDRDRDRGGIGAESEHFPALIVSASD